MSAPQHKLIAVTVHTSPTPRRLAVGADGVVGIEVKPAPSGHHNVTIVLADGRYIGFYGFPVEMETDPQLIATPTGVKLT
jgi:hypothetical protein